MYKQTQQARLIEELLTKGFVNSYYATYTMGIKQAPTRIYELKQLGYNWIAKIKPDRSVDWILQDKPKPETPRLTVRQGIWKFNGGDAVFVPIEEIEPKQL
jgi:hypothetical protein